MADTQYKPTQIIMASRGLHAREALDRLPANTYLNMNGVYERAENALSSRFGNIIVNRDAVGAGTANHLLPYAPIVLSRLKSINGATYRYAALSNGDLYRRSTDIQGAYSSILTGLSRRPFDALVTTCFQSSLPFLFLFDPMTPVKDSGAGTPTRIGIFPPVRPVTTQAYAPDYRLLVDYDATPTYDGGAALALLSVGSYVIPSAVPGVSQLSGDHWRYAWGGTLPQLRGISSVARGLAYESSPAAYFDWTADGAVYVTPDTFTFPFQTFAIQPAAVGTMTNAVAAADTSFDVTMTTNVLQAGQIIAIGGELISVTTITGSANPYTITACVRGYQGTTAADYALGAGWATSGQSIEFAVNGDFRTAPANASFVLDGFGVFNPIAIGTVQLQFDVGGSGYVNYYSAQLSIPNELATPLRSHVMIFPSSGVPVSVQKSAFGAMGGAGTVGWSGITGVRLYVTPTTAGMSSGGFISLNSIYATGLSGTLPSSVGGVGYDYRYTYKNFNTGTPSNPDPQQYFPITTANPSGTSTLVVYGQSIEVSGQYSSDPQVTHVQIWRRGGVYGSDWYYLGQIPNVTGTGTWSYEDSSPDSALQQSTALTASGGLAMDVPVTSTLQTPISTTLSTALTPTAPSTPTLLTVTVAQSSAVFVPNQVVNIGTLTNFEQTVVVTGGTGTFTAWVQLDHTGPASPVLGEPVQVYSLPGISCNLAALAYNQLWRAGDPYNPHYLYYSPVGYPENVPPQNYIPVGSPSDPITLIVNYGGNLFVSTLFTWYRVYPGLSGSAPYAASTGSTRGCVASFGWTMVEGELWYPSADGFRSFRGVEGAYQTLPIEWLWQGNPLTPVPLVDTTKLGSILGAYRDNNAYFVYMGKDGNPHRLSWHTLYKRWRNDDIPVTAIYLETDTDTLVYAKPMTIGGVSGWAIVYDTYSQDYDDGGWVSGALAQLPIPITIQTPYMDQGLPNNQKQYNALTIDANPNGQVLSVQLLFDDNNGSVAPVTPTPATFTGSARAKFEFQINGGDGQPAYRMSPVITGAVTAAPELYQIDFHTAELAECRVSYDSYWVHWGNELQKLVKQGYFDYTTSGSNTISGAVYADGSTTPYFTFTLPTNPSRSSVPMRVRFGNSLGVGITSLRLFRLIMTSTAPFQLWSPLMVDQKPLLPSGTSGYHKTPLGDTAP